GRRAVSARALGPAELGRGRPGIRAALLGRSADRTVRDRLVRAGAQAGQESLLHAPVLAGVKAEDGDAAAGPEAAREDAQQRVERTELVVDLDAQRLEDPALRVRSVEVREPRARRRQRG